MRLFIDKVVAIHNKNGKGLLHANDFACTGADPTVAIHNKNGKGLLQTAARLVNSCVWSQSTIKMEKGYYRQTKR